jgi:hypothetical protein
MADLSAGKDISQIESVLKQNVIPVKKELLLNSTSLGIFIDNLEGICRGPKLPDGRESLVMVVDNNFSPNQRSQVLVFALD